MNDQVFGVHCSNGFCEFDSHTTTNIQTKYDLYWIILTDKIINMYEAIEHYKVYKQEKKLSNNSSKLVSEYDKVSFDKWMNELIKKNGTTKY